MLLRFRTTSVRLSAQVAQLMLVGKNGFFIIVPRKCNVIDQSFRRSWGVKGLRREQRDGVGVRDALVVMRGLERYRPKFLTEIGDLHWSRWRCVA